MTGAEKETARRLIALGHYSDNPWQALVYSGLSARGIETDLRPFDDGLEDAGSGDVVHVNWTGPISQTAASAEAAQQDVLVALTALRRASARGARVLTTIHNCLPHEMRYRDAELLLQRGLAGMADRIHVMNPCTPALVGAWYQLPEERVVTIPHPSYHGWYPDQLPRDAARSRLGLSRDAIVAAHFGAIRGYKGLRRLVTAFEHWRAHEPRAVLVIGGRLGEGADSELLAELRDRDDVRLMLDHVEDDTLALWHSAADFVALPYTAGLNSGACALAMTFGLPVVATDTHAIDAYRGSRWLRVADSGDEWLADAVADEAWLASGRWAEEDALAIVPSVVADTFEKIVHELLSLPVADPAPWRAAASRVGIVVVSYGSSSLLPACLDGLVDVYPVVVVDSRTDEFERRAVQDWASRAGAMALPLDDNPGFGAAANAGARLLLAESDVERVLLLNPDVVADPDAIAALAASAAASPGAMVAATIITPSGALWFRGGVIDLDTGFARHLAHGESRSVDWLTAACLLVPAEAFKSLGGFSPDYFLYWEDVALTFGWAKRGHALIVDPATVVHDVGGTQTTVGGLKSLDYSYWNARNRLVFAAEHLGTRWTSLWTRNAGAYVNELLHRAAPSGRAVQRAHRRAAWRGTLAGIFALTSARQRRG